MLKEIGAKLYRAEYKVLVSYAHTARGTPVKFLIQVALSHRAERLSASSDINGANLATTISPRVNTVVSARRIQALVTSIKTICCKAAYLVVQRKQVAHAVVKKRALAPVYRCHTLLRRISYAL